MATVWRWVGQILNLLVLCLFRILYAKNYIRKKFLKLIRFTVQFGFVWILRCATRQLIGCCRRRRGVWCAPISYICRTITERWQRCSRYDTKRSKQWQPSAYHQYVHSYPAVSGLRTHQAPCSVSREWNQLWSTDVSRTGRHTARRTYRPWKEECCGCWRYKRML